MCVGDDREARKFTMGRYFIRVDFSVDEIVDFFFVVVFFFISTYIRTDRRTDGWENYHNRHMDSRSSNGVVGQGDMWM